MHDDAGAVQPYYVFLLLLLSCVVGIAIGWAGVNAQAHLTATSFLVVGNVNKFVVGRNLSQQGRPRRMPPKAK